MSDATPAPTEPNPTLTQPPRPGDSAAARDTTPLHPGPAADAAVAQLIARFDTPQCPGEIGRLGGYRVLALLGRGGMGAVFEAEEIALGRRVALKVMLADLAARSDARARFLREARHAAKLTHDHVVPVLRVDEAGGLPFIVMPRLAGRSLDERLRRGPPPGIAEIVQVGREVAAGLHAAHTAGLIHRDVKPANVWLEERPGGGFRVKLLDFGLARTEDGDTVSLQPGSLVGTPAYMSPEQADGGTLDYRTDLFSLGVLLYRMTTTDSPFHRPSLVATLRAVCDHRPAPVETYRPEIPPHVAELIDRLMAKDPSDRPQSAAAVEAALAGTAALPRNEPRSRRGTLALLGGFAVVVAVAVYWFLKSHPPPPPDVPDSLFQALKPTASLRSALGTAADEIVAAMRANNLEAVRVGEFAGPSPDAAEYGEHIADLLTDALAQRGVLVKRNAPVGVKGSFTVGIDKQSGMAAVSVTGEVTDRKKSVVLTFVRGILQGEGDLQTTEP